MTSLMVDLTSGQTATGTESEAIQVEEEKKEAAPSIMSGEELDHLLIEIEKRQNSDAKAALNLIKLIFVSQ